MAVRALVIAIENYPVVQVGGIAKQLPGTLKAGLDFKAWLLAKWNSGGRTDTQLIFCSDPVQPNGMGATADDIRGALLKLKADGQSATDELYFFFSGHGFSFIDKPGSRADVVMASDFKQPALSGNACLNLDQIIAWLRAHLGAGHHFYFVDACRNALDRTQVVIGDLLPFDPQASGEASTYLLQSTVDGAVAAVNDQFSVTLMDGLKGKGRAKIWDVQATDKMYVRYDSLRAHMKSLLANIQRITSRVDGSDGESDGVLATLKPVPKSKCTITIEGSPAAVDAEIVLRRGRSGTDQRQPLSSQPAVIELEPDDYAVSLRLNNEAAKTATPMPVDLYDDRSIVFKHAAATAMRGGLESMPSGLESTISDVHIVVPRDATFDIRNMNTGFEKSFTQSVRERLPPGRYFATLRSREGQVFKRQDIDLDGGEHTLNVAEWRQSAPHVAIASHLPPHAVQGDALDFSESLGGAVTDPDLDLWLALIGGGRILGPFGDYSKLAAFPLHDFSNEKSGAAPIYVLAGLENPAAVLEVGVSRTADVTWMRATQPDAMPGIRDAYFPRQAGWRLVSFRIDGGAPYTVASLASPNRAMLITLTLDSEDNIRLSQYLLPLGHLVHNLPPVVEQMLSQRNHLRDVKFLAQASRAFRKRRDLSKELPMEQLRDLLYAKWLDPIASSLAAYEFIRRNRKDEMHGVIENMTAYFKDLPDTAALAKLMGREIARPKGPPLFVDGLRAFPRERTWLPLPAGHLDYASPWTAWRAAVKGSEE
jgi:hypothetical protein